MLSWLGRATAELVAGVAELATACTGREGCTEQPVLPGCYAWFTGDPEGRRGLHGKVVRVLWITPTRAQVYWPSRGKSTNVKLLNLQRI